MTQQPATDRAVVPRDRRVLIVGGYGTFGGRIVALLESEPRITLIVAGRALAKARAFCAGRGTTAAALVPAIFDRDGDLDDQLRDLSPEIVIDASGPFQAYGDGRYRLVEACIRRRVHYLDLADGSDFVAGIAAFDSAARESGVAVLSGVSSFPVLTAAVVRRLSGGFARLDTIRGGIAPSPYAGVGENVIRAIAGYAGQRVAVRRDGVAAVGHPFTEHMRYTIAPPGRLQLRSTLFSLVDVPDLRALAESWPQAKTVWMGAGPVPQVLHRALIGCAWLVRLGVLRSLTPLARLMHAATNRLRWGDHRGGMFVTVTGVDAAGKPGARSWHLLAEGDDGPLIPSMAVAAILRRTLEGNPPAPGARAAVGDLELNDYDGQFAGKTIVTGFRDDTASDAPLYARLLGTAWDALPAEIRAMHAVTGDACAEGRAKVERGNSGFSRMVGAMMGFPREGDNVPVRVDFHVRGGTDTWIRTFGKDRFSSQQFAGTGKFERLLCERFGAMTFAMALVVEDGRLTLVLRHWTVFGLAMPLWLAPRSKAYETVEDGRFRFHVEISHFLTGFIVRYSGWLEPSVSSGAAQADNVTVSPAIAPSSTQD